ncbi:MAG: ABC transporter ATP-binding protein [Chlamydiales bacterium]|nr:ABC transporter ATP-binding protein [Chlamydiales bacterium]
MKIRSYNRDYDREKISVQGLDYRLLKRLFSYLAPYRAYVLLSVVLLVFAKAIEALVPILIGHLAETILGVSQTSPNFPQELLRWGLWLGGLLILGYIFDASNVLVKNWVGQHALLTLRSETYDAIQRMPISFFDRESVGRLMSRTIHDVDQINQLYSESIVPIIGNIILLLGILAGALYLSWEVALIALLVFPILFYLTISFRKEQSRCFELLRAVVSSLNTFIQERLMGASTIWVFGTRKREKKEFEQINQDHCTVHLESIHNLGIFLAGIQFLHSLVLIMIFAALVLLSPAGSDFDAGMFFTFSLYALMVFRPIADLAERYNVLQAAIASGGRIFDILDREQENYSKGINLTSIQTISFEDVWFAYQADNWVLRGLSFTVNNGESIAVVGVTGAGKTTIMGLLLRLYDYQRGTIKVNGRNILEYSLDSLRRQFSVVPQEPMLFSGTIAQNIAMEDPDFPLAAIQQAADYVDLSPLIQRNALGYDQIISGTGGGLSAGEAQLITLARAVAHNGSVYILDEATANIDTVSEKKIQAAMNRILAEKTAIVIAHRLSTIQHATRILVLNQGQVAEEGSHEALLRLGGIYEKLYRLQFLDI